MQKENQPPQEEKTINAQMGCPIAASLIVNFLITITIIHSLNGFWVCTGAFLAFMIVGTLGGILGIVVGQAIAKAKEEVETITIITYSVVGALIASIIADTAIGKLLFGINIQNLL